MIVGESVTFSGYRTAAKIIAYLSLTVAATALISNYFNPSVLDFISYWSAAVLALQGNAVGAYDIELHKAVQGAVLDYQGLMPFAYPPPFLLLLTPFGLLPYALAAGLWVAVTFAGYFFAARKFAPSSGWLAAAFPPVVVNGVIGQSGFLTGGIFIGGMVLLGRRPMTAGLLLGCLIVKPHLAVLLPVAFVAGRQWRAFIGAAISSSALLLLALLVYGTDAYEAWIKLTPFFAAIVADGLVGWHKMASVYASLRLVGMASWWAWAFHVAIACVAVTATWLVWRKENDLRAKTALLAAATVLTSPYLYGYDTLILIVPFFWLASVHANKNLLVLLWCVPFISVGQNFGLNQLVNLTPVVSILLFALIILKLLPPLSRLAAARASNERHSSEFSPVGAHPVRNMSSNRSAILPSSSA